MKAEIHTSRLGWQPITGKFATPVYYEGEELPGGATSGTPAPAPPADAPAEASAPPAEGAAPPDLPPWEGKTPEELWNRNDELIKENTKYKERYRPWEQATEGLAPEDVDFYRDFLVAVQTQDQAKLSQLAPAMRAALDQLTPAQQDALADAAQAAAEEFDPFDPKQIDARIETRAKAILDERDAANKQEQAVQKALNDMNSRLSELAKPDSDGGVGIPGLADPTSPDYGVVLWMAQNDKSLSDIGDPMERLEKAASKYRDHLDERAQELLKAKSTGDPVPASPQAGQPSGSKAPSTFEESRAAGAARLEAILAGPGT